MHGINEMTLANGKVVVPSIAGRTWLHEVWKDA